MIRNPRQTEIARANLKTCELITSIAFETAVRKIGWEPEIIQKRQGQPKAGTNTNLKRAALVLHVRDRGMPHNAINAVFGCSAGWAAKVVRSARGWLSVRDPEFTRINNELAGAMAEK